MSVWPLAAVYGWVLSQGGGCDHAVGITGHRPAESDNGDSEQTWMHTRGAELMGDVCSDQAGHDPGKASEVMQPSNCICAFLLGWARRNGCPGMASHPSVTVVLFGGMSNFTQCMQVNSSQCRAMRKLCEGHLVETGQEASGGWDGVVWISKP